MEHISAQALRRTFNWSECGTGDQDCFFEAPEIILLCIQDWEPL